MNYTVLRETFAPCEFDKKEILRYAGVKNNGDDIKNLIDVCIDKLKDNYSFNVCYANVPLSVNGNNCDFGAFSVNSKSLSKHLSGCDGAVVFAATLGLSADRIISKYSAVSPSHALILDSIATERIEALCDMFCDKLSKNMFVTSRFSAGYADVPIDVQKSIFMLLDCYKHIGLTLNDSLIMSPSKSVTAIVGTRSNI